MTTYNAGAVSNTAIAYQKPITLQQGRALRDNPIAIAEGATGALRIMGEALARENNGLPVLTVAAADTYALTEGAGGEVVTLVANSTSDVVAHRWTLSAFDGSVRVRGSHSVDGNGITITLSLFKNGILVQSFSLVGGVLPVSAARVVDVSVLAGDVLEWRHRSSNASFPSSFSNAAISASNAYVIQPAYRRAVP